MHYLRPKLFSVLNNYNKKLLFKDIVAGIIVGIIAIPLSIALAIASGLRPETGLYTAIIGGFFISFFGGSRVQIGGPTAAFIPLVYSVNKEFGTDGLIIATLIASLFLILMGVFKIGKMIKYIPYPLVTGFTTGIALTILIKQFKDFFGFQEISTTSNVKILINYLNNISSINLNTFLIGMLALLIIIYWRKIPIKGIEYIPSSLIAIIITTLLINVFNIKEVLLIGDVYDDISFGIPSFTFPQNISLSLVKKLLSFAFAIAILAGIESLLSAVVADGMIGGHHRSDAELLAQGIANAFSVLFGGMPVTGAIARTAANIKNGAHSPISGIVHSISILLIMLLLTSYLKLIPITTLAAILIVVAYNIGDWKSFKTLHKAPKSDTSVFLITLFLTVIFDLTIAIEVGIVLASFLFMRRMAEISEVVLVEDKKNTDIISEEVLRQDINKLFGSSVLLYEIKGPFFFGASEKIFNTTADFKNKPKFIILNMKEVPAIDLTGMHSLERLNLLCINNNAKLVISNLQARTYRALEKYGFIKTIGDNNICKNVEAAIMKIINY